MELRKIDFGLAPEIEFGVGGTLGAASDRMFSDCEKIHSEYSNAGASAGTRGFLREGRNQRGSGRRYQLEFTSPGHVGRSRLLRCFRRRS